MPPTSSTSVSDPQQLQELIDQLQAVAGRDLPFLTRLVETQCRLAGASFGAVFVTDEGKPPRILSVFPLSPTRRVRVEPERLKILKDCAARCRDGGKMELFRVALKEGVFHAIATPLMRLGRVEGVSVILTPPGSGEETIQLSRLAPLQMLSSLYAGHVARRMLHRQSVTATETKSALAVLSSAHQAEHFSACAMAVCNRAKTELGAWRVALGWSHGNTVRLEAMSDTENLDRRQEVSQRIEAAMEECFDQAQAVTCPADHLRGSDEWLAQSVARCHHELIGDDGRLCVASVPLRHGDEVLGVLTVERSSAAGGGGLFDGQSVSHLQAIADLVTPRLADRWADDRLLITKAWASTKWALGKLIGPEYVGWKLAVVAIVSAVIYSLVVTWDYRVDAPFTLEAGARQVYAASFAGFLQSVKAKEADPVVPGQELARLDDTELKLELLKAQSMLTEAQTQRIQSLQKNELGDAKRAEALASQYAAQRDLLAYQISRAALVASEAGVVLKGDWDEKIGVRMELGAPIFEVAPIEKLRAVILVDESDIDRVAPGSNGELATRTHPEQTFGFKVTRIVPAGAEHEGRNVFQVFVELDRHADWMRPGMAGKAKIDAGRQTVAWIATHKLVDFLRLNLWW